MSVTVLGIESSCDETSAAVMRDGALLSNIISSQLVHTQYGGVVPELASRAHQTMIVPVVNEALSAAGVTKETLSAVAVSRGPGLMGALLVGVNFAKSYAYGLGVPVIGVNHMEGHIYSNFIDDPSPAFPFLNLTVSGGHTQLVLVRDEFDYEIVGETMDDAAGEAFDKVGKMLGLEYPAGPLIDRWAKKGDPHAVRFPRPAADGGNRFSFSGIKTSMLYHLRDRGLRGTVIPEPVLADLCASFQSTVVGVLVERTLDAARRAGVKDIAIAGGVAANSELRRRMTEGAAEAGFRLFIPALPYCTDNAAMVAEVGRRKFVRGLFDTLQMTATANLEL